MRGGVALISNLTIANQYVSMKEEKEIRYKNRFHFQESSGFFKRTEQKKTILSSSRRTMPCPVSFNLSIRATWEPQKYTFVCSSASYQKKIFERYSLLDRDEGWSDETLALL